MAILVIALFKTTFFAWNNIAIIGIDFLPDDVGLLWVIDNIGNDAIIPTVICRRLINMQASLIGDNVRGMHGRNDGRSKP